MKNINKIIAALLSATLCCSGMTLLTAAHEQTAADLLDKYIAYVDYKTYSVNGEMRSYFTQKEQTGYMVSVDENGIVNENPDVVAILKDCQDTYPEMSVALYYVTPDGRVWSNAATGDYFYHGTRSGSFIYDRKEDGSALIVGCDYRALAEQKLSVLEIPAEIDGLPVTEIGMFAFRGLRYNLPLQQIIIPDSVTIIRDYAFSQALPCDADCTINIPKQVEMIADHAFAGLGTALGSTVTLPETLEYLDVLAFESTDIDAFNFPNSLVLSPGFVKAGFAKEVSFALPNFVTSSDVQAYFEAKDAAKSLPTIAPNGDVNQSGTTEIGDAILLSRMVAEDASVTVSAEGIAAADVVTDGTLDGADITAILQIIANPNA